MTTVITYASDTGLTVDLTLPQIRKLTAAHKWPRDRRGTEYCQVSHGAHLGQPTWSDAALAAEVGGETL